MNKTAQLDDLVGDVAPLLGRLSRESDPEIAALVERVDAAILETWTAVARQASEAASARRGQRLVLIGAAFLIAATAGILAERYAWRARAH